MEGFFFFFPSIFSDFFLSRSCLWQHKVWLYNTLDLQHLSSIRKPPLCLCPARSHLPAFTGWAWIQGLCEYHHSSHRFITHHPPSSCELTWRRGLPIKKGDAVNIPQDPFSHLLWLQLFSPRMWLRVRHEPRVTKVTPHLVRTIFSLPFLSGSIDLPSLISANPTATAHFGKTAKSSQAYLNSFSLCFAQARKVLLDFWLASRRLCVFFF